eukprot:10093795-Lingulodinium_polyedra.AAC.1
MLLPIGLRHGCIQDARVLHACVPRVCLITALQLACLLACLQHCPMMNNEVHDENNGENDEVDDAILM